MDLRQYLLSCDIPIIAQKSYLQKVFTSKFDIVLEEIFAFTRFGDKERKINIWNIHCSKRWVKYSLVIGMRYQIASPGIKTPLPYSKGMARPFLASRIPAVFISPSINHGSFLA
jgi:hypothetical protein